MSSPIRLGWKKKFHKIKLDLWNVWDHDIIKVALKSQLDKEPRIPPKTQKIAVVMSLQSTLEIVFDAKVIDGEDQSLLCAPMEEEEVLEEPQNKDYKVG